MGFHERSEGMAGFEVPGDLDNMASKEADRLEDLKLMTKRMKVRVKSIEENLDMILKRSQLKRQRLLRNRKRPATMHTIERFSLRPTPSKLKSIQSVPTLRNPQASGDDVVVNKRGIKFRKSASETNIAAQSTLSSVETTEQSIGTQERGWKNPIEPAAIDFKSLDKVIAHQHSDHNRNRSIDFPQKVHRLKQSLNFHAKSVPWKERHRSILQKGLMYRQFVEHYPKLRGIHASEKVEARQKVMQLEEMKNKWSALISKEVQQSMSTKLAVLLSWQKRWFSLIKFGVVVKIFGEKLAQKQQAQQDMQAQIDAISKLQQGWKKSYTRRMTAKHEKTVEILKKRAWVARMNVAARHRTSAAKLLRGFCKDYVGKSKFVELIRKFKYKMLRLQRFIRDAHNITQAQITAISKYWSAHEHRVLMEMEKEAIAEERAKALARLKARKVGRRKSTVTEAEVEAAMLAGAATLFDQRREKRSKEVNESVGDLTDLLTRRQKVIKRHGHVVPLPLGRQIAGEHNVEGALEVAKREKRQEEYIKAYAPEMMSRFKPAAHLLRRETIGSWLKEVQADFSERRGRIQEERKRANATISLADIREMMVIKGRGEEATIDFVDNRVHMAENPIVFSLYSKYMKRDIEYLIKEGVQRQEEEEMSYLKKLNNRQDANLRHRRRKRLNDRAQKILKGRLGGATFYYLDQVTKG